MNISEKTIKKLIIFTIIMSDDDNILEKSPDYINEKAKKIFMSPGEIKTKLNLLDDDNLEIYKKYCKKWGV